MDVLRLRLRTLQIAVAALALTMAIAVPALLDSAREAEFYGPGGVQDRRVGVWAEVTAGRDALACGRPAEAEASFRSALECIGRNVGAIPLDMSVSFFREKSAALAGLADALAARGQLAEAVPVYGEALTTYKGGLAVVSPEFDMYDDAEVADLLKRREACSASLDRRAGSKK